VLSALAAGVACGTIRRRSAFAQSTVDEAGVEGEVGPTFTRDGPNARLYGLDEGYPVPEVPHAVLEGNPWEPKYRVGAFSHLDEDDSCLRCALVVEAVVCGGSLRVSRTTV
jgi:hypothetical protein